ncbi:Hpt domain-containing protein [Massilia sp. YMA4]|uniref:Hpt domain-containing protein n=1 Tax=[Empedobacter] haloabium TaxID=592317 RepID=A0ABZ1UJV5_9BURK|nr:Hpt domain-containing protein [Massilia sp. YMA4]AXA93529.1 phosphotransfer domain-containing protein [Massilia sp. YMA4]
MGIRFDPAEAAALPALDATHGLARLLGDQQVYANVLRRFSGYVSCVEEARAQLAAGDRDAAHRTLHTLKGAAGLVSAPRLYMLAGRAEHAMERGEPVDELLAPLQAALTALLAAIAEELERNPPPPVALDASEESDGAVLLQELARLLDEGNGSAVDLAARYAPLLAETVGAEHWRAVAAAVDDYDFDRALELLRPAL